MSADLMGMLKLAHHVTGFLIRLSPQQLTGLAAGHLTLAVARHAAEPGEPPARGPEPEPPGRGAEPESPGRGPEPEPPGRGGPGSTRPTPGPVAASARADFAEIAATLRRQETLDGGLAYLDGIKVGGKKLMKADLLAIGRELQLTLPAGSTVANAKRKLLEQAIGARRKYAGLAP